MVASYTFPPGGVWRGVDSQLDANLKKESHLTRPRQQTNPLPPPSPSKSDRLHYFSFFSFFIHPVPLSLSSLPLSSPLLLNLVSRLKRESQREGIYIYIYRSNFTGGVTGDAPSMLIRRDETTGQTVTKKLMEYSISAGGYATIAVGIIKSRIIYEAQFIDQETKERLSGILFVCS